MTILLISTVNYYILPLVCQIMKLFHLTSCLFRVLASPDELSKSQSYNPQSVRALRFARPPTQSGPAASIRAGFHHEHRSETGRRSRSHSRAAATPGRREPRGVPIGRKSENCEGERAGRELRPRVFGAGTTSVELFKSIPPYAHQSPTSHHSRPRLHCESSPEFVPST